MLKSKKNAMWGGMAIVTVLAFLGTRLSVWSAVVSFLVPQGRTWHDLLTAVGTCLAVVVALWLGWDARRRDARDRMELAQLVASEISVRLADLEGRIGALEARLIFGDSGRDQLKVVHDALSDKNLLLFRRDTLAALIPLPRQTAHRIARAMDYLRLLRARITEDGFGSGGDAQLSRIHGMVLEMIGHARAELQIAAEECNCAAMIARPDIPPDAAWADD